VVAVAHDLAIGVTIVEFSKRFRKIRPSETAEKEANDSMLALRHRWYQQ